MKTCSICKLKLEFICFNKKRKIPLVYQSICIECNKQYQKEHYKRNKNKYILKAKIRKEKLKQNVRDIKTATPCRDCNNYYHYCQMDFDHINAKDKISNIADIINGTPSWKKIQSEIDKCELVCSNCHRLRTFKRLKNLY